MRVTQQSIIIPYQSSLQDIQERKFKDEIRLSSGKQLISISDDPKNAIDSKRIGNVIDRNQKYKSNIDSALSEIYSIHDQNEAIGNTLQEIRQTAIEATFTGNSGSAYTLGTNVRGLLDDLVKLANKDYNGKFLLSGTLTTPNSLVSKGGKENTPFEVIKGQPTIQNPSGLSVVFKGNMSDRKIDKDSTSTEVINTKADEIFGKNGTELFQSVIDLYNKLTYDSNGNNRNEKIPLSRQDQADISEVQANLANFSDEINRVNGKVGVKMNRLQALSDQTIEENTRLKEVLSRINDTDIAKTSIDYHKEDTALQYSLQVGSKIMQQSLLDFLR